jgi:hypothetical protein
MQRHVTPMMLRHKRRSVQNGIPSGRAQADGGVIAT